MAKVTFRGVTANTKTRRAYNTKTGRFMNRAERKKARQNFSRRKSNGGGGG